MRWQEEIMVSISWEMGYISARDLAMLSKLTLPPRCFAITTNLQNAISQLSTNKPSFLHKLVLYDVYMDMLPEWTLQLGLELCIWRYLTIVR